jgi:hypothetical protein
MRAKRGVPGTHLIGAAAELAVCTRALRKGYYVYRSVSPSGPFDLIFVKKDLDDPRIFREVVTVEVKSLEQRIVKHKTNIFPPSMRERHNADWLIRVHLKSGKMWKLVDDEVSRF